MAYIMSEQPWHEGEHKMQSLMRVPRIDNPNSPFLIPRAGPYMSRAPLIVVGTLDKEARPWTTVWGGDPGMARPVAESIIGIRNQVDGRYDPVVETLLGGNADGEIVREEGDGRPMSGLTINLETRDRIKLMGRMIAGALGKVGEGIEEQGAGIAQLQLVVKIEQSLGKLVDPHSRRTMADLEQGNCPKYLNCKHIYPSMLQPRMISDSAHLPQQALDLVGKADTMFISSSHGKSDMDSNIRGGPPGFVRVLSNDESGAVLVWPEYSGNRLYQTLGNLLSTPRAGLVFPDFETGDVLYVTGDTEVLATKDAAALLPKSNLAVKLRVTAARFVEKGLPFRGELLERSPYNPRVRYLTTEKPLTTAEANDDDSVTAKLIKKERLTPTISRYRFSVSDPVKGGTWKPGQYVALSFANELDYGYSHMSDEEPTSLNDDYLRSFTISSHHPEGLHEEEFEITVRNVGSVTRHLSMQSARSGMEVSLKGFDGQFFIKQKPGQVIPFIAAGIGITPVLAQLPDLDLTNFRLFWTIGVKDIGLVQDVFKRTPELARSTDLFITGDASSLDEKEREQLDEVLTSDAKVERRRLEATDLDGSLAPEWYLCTSVALKARLVEWLPGKILHFEAFDY